MTIQQIWEYPPKPFLEQVAKNCPKATRIYMKLWDKRDKNNRVILPEEEFECTFHPNSLDDNLRKLNDEGLISIFKISHGRKAVELVDWQEIE